MAWGWVKYFSITVFCIAVVPFTASLPVFADIYRYIDKNGVHHFTNVPASSSPKYRIYIREKSGKSLSLYKTDRYDIFIKEASKRHGISFPLLKAIIKVESNFNPRAVSRSGALGLMQIMPENIKSLNINDPFDPCENIMGGALFFKRLVKRFDEKLPLALAAYNAGPNIVDRYKSIPPFKETKDYVEKVMKYYNIFKK